MNETVISWTFANWITVLLMVFLGSTILGAVLAAINSARKNGK